MKQVGKNSRTDMYVFYVFNLDEGGILDDKMWINVYKHRSGQDDCEES